LQKNEAKMADSLVPILVPLSLFLMITAIVVTPIWLRSRERTKVLEVVRSISEQGATPPAQLLTALESIAQRDTPLASPERDMRRGSILLAVSAATIALGVALYFISGRQEPMLSLIGLAAFPCFIGLTQIGFWLASRKRNA
jgi:hypothetical protein